MKKHYKKGPDPKLKQMGDHATRFFSKKLVYINLVPHLPKLKKLLEPR